MKTKFSILTKLMLILCFLIGVGMMSRISCVGEETELIYGTVEATYIQNKRTTLSSHKCRVVWTDLEGDKHINGFPNDAYYEVGDLYPLMVDAETNSREALSTAEYIILFMIGLIMCIICIVIWKKKKDAVKVSKQIQEIEELHNR